MSKKKLVVLSGAGISAESGIKTFRDSDGTWENYSIYEVATPEGWRKNPQLVLDFYNKRRRDLDNVHPNDAHKALVDLEKHFDVHIITQNVDDLHERAGSTNVLHLHGELKKMRSDIQPHNEYRAVPYDKDIKLGDLALDGGQFRPHIVWFNEDVPDMMKAAEIASEADILVVVGTSLNVYPAASVLTIVPDECEIYAIDPKMPDGLPEHVTCIKATATEGMKDLLKYLIVTK